MKTLFHPFENGTLAPPRDGARLLVLNAPAGLRLPGGFDVKALLVQDMRPAFNALSAAGHDVAPAPEGQGYDLAFVLAGRHRGRNELDIAEALERVRPGGLVVAAGGKTDGAASLRKRLAGLLPVEGHAAKHHGVVFWLRAGAEAPEAAAGLRAANPSVTVEGGFATGPGLFSHDRIDPGSRLLAAHLPGDLAGHAADFGAGWGYLSVMLARRAPGAASIDLYEAGHEATRMAAKNMAALAPAVAARVLWRDLLAEPAERRYDLIVMNPPFHDGARADPAIGTGMIAAARRALAPRGRLLMVANAHLPYEAGLSKLFARSGETLRADGFKLLWAAA